MLPAIKSLLLENIQSINANAGFAHKKQWDSGEKASNKVYIIFLTILTHGEKYYEAENWILMKRKKAEMYL